MHSLNVLLRRGNPILGGKILSCEKANEMKFYFAKICLIFVDY